MCCAYLPWQLKVEEKIDENWNLHRKTYEFFHFIAKSKFLFDLSVFFSSQPSLGSRWENIWCILHRILNSTEAEMIKSLFIIH